MVFFAAIFAALFLLTPDALRADSVPPLSSYNWAVNASPNLTTQPPPVEAVQNFVGQPLFN